MGGKDIPKMCGAKVGLKWVLRSVKSLIELECCLTVNLVARARTEDAGRDKKFQVSIYRESSDKVNRVQKLHGEKIQLIED